MITTIPDADLAQKLGISYAAVRARRIIRGLPPFKHWQRPWTAAEDALLGTDYDPVIGKKTGRGRERVRQRRLLLRIPGFQPRFRRWTRSEEKLLGTMPDKKLARLLKRGVTAVSSRRRRKHLPMFGWAVHRWTPADEKLLGTRPDDQVARLLKLSVIAVKAHRRDKGIRRFGFASPHPHRKSLNRELWTPAEEALLGKLPDRVVAARLCRTLKAVKHRRCRGSGITRPRRLIWTAAQIALLGARPDADLAALWNISAVSVANQRRKLGIKPKPALPKPWKPKEDKLLATLPDDQVARLLGRSWDAVRSRRHYLGIPRASRARSADPFPRNEPQSQDNRRNNSSARLRPSSVKTTDLAFPTGS